MITFEHAKRLVLTSAEIMVREPEKHGYAHGGTVLPIAIKEGRTCFCLMGGAAVLLLAERGQTYTRKDTTYFGKDLQRAWKDLLKALDYPLWGDLVRDHDNTQDVNEMYAKVKARFE